MENSNFIHDIIDEEIASGKVSDLGRTRRQPQNKRNEKPLNKPNSYGTAKGDSQSLHQQFGLLGHILSAISLSCHTAGADTQETEIPVQQVKEHCSDGNTTNSGDIRDVSDNSRIH